MTYINYRPLQSRAQQIPGTENYFVVFCIFQSSYLTSSVSLFFLIPPNNACIVELLTSSSKKFEH